MVADVRNKYAHREDYFDLNDPEVKKNVEDFIASANQIYGGDIVTVFKLVSRKVNGSNAEYSSHTWYETQVVKFLCGAAALKIHMLAAAASPQPVFRMLKSPKLIFNLGEGWS